jgi:hypothetical protein
MSHFEGTVLEGQKVTRFGASPLRESTKVNPTLR